MVTSTHRFSPNILIGLVACTLLVLTGCPQGSDPVDPTDPVTPRPPIVVDPPDTTADERDDSPDQVADEQGDQSVEALTVSGASPATGPVDGGVSVTLTGEGFDDTVRVTFGAVEGTSLTLTSSQTLSVTAPAGAAGVVDITLTRGDGQQATLSQAFTYEAGIPAPTISFCQLQAQSPVAATTGQDFPELYTVVFAEGITNAAGQGAGIQVQLGWFPTGGPVDTFTYTDMAYNLDKDGLVDGDLANDEYSGKLIISDAGTYGYAARARLNNGGEWFYCDLDGNDGAAEPFEVDQAGIVVVSEPQAAPTPDRCAIQFPTLLAQVEVGQPLSFFGRVFEAGVTDVTDDDPSVNMELLVGPVDADPVASPGAFTAYPTTFHGQINTDEDEYTATWTPSMAGRYKFLFRASVNAGTDYILCDADESTGAADFQNTRTGFVNVTTSPEDLVEYCHVFQTGVMDSLADPSLPIFTMEAYEAGVTDQNNAGANAADLIIELGYGPLSDNPAFDGAYSWNPTSFARVVGNNYEYEGDPYGVQSPTQGDYGVVARVRRSAGTTWQYCDHDNTTMEFLLGSVSTLNVSL